MKPLRGRGSSLRAIAVVFLMMGVLFLGILGTTEHGSALGSAIEYSETVSGYLYAGGDTWPPAVSTSLLILPISILVKDTTLGQVMIMNDSGHSFHSILPLSQAQRRLNVQCLSCTS